MNNVNHPQHYNQLQGLECIDVIEALDLNFNLGNVIKYIWRCGYKDDELQELKKALWYLQREVERVQEIYQASKIEEV